MNLSRINELLENPIDMDDLPVSTESITATDPDTTRVFTLGQEKWNVFTQAICSDIATDSETNFKDAFIELAKIRHVIAEQLHQYKTSNDFGIFRSENYFCLEYFTRTGSGSWPRQGVIVNQLIDNWLDSEQLPINCEKDTWGDGIIEKDGERIKLDRWVISAPLQDEEINLIGANLYIMNTAPSDFGLYKDSYILTESNEQVFYVNANGEEKRLDIDDSSKFMDDIEELNPDHKTQIYLNEQNISNIIQQNVYHELTTYTKIVRASYLDSVKPAEVQLQYEFINPNKLKKIYEVADLHWQALDNLNESSKIDEFLTHSAKMAYMVLHTLPTKRGTSAILDWMIRGKAQKHGISLGLYNQNPNDLSWTIKALTTTSMDEYVAWYKENAFSDCHFLDHQHEHQLDEETSHPHL